MPPPAQVGPNRPNGLNCKQEPPRHLFKVDHSYPSSMTEQLGQCVRGLRRTHRSALHFNLVSSLIFFIGIFIIEPLLKTANTWRTGLIH